MNTGEDEVWREQVDVLNVLLRILENSGLLKVSYADYESNGIFCT